MPIIIDLMGMQFDALTVIAPTPGPRGRVWVCRCVCGNTKVVSTAHLRRRAVTNCGCRKPDEIRARFTVHGHNRLGQRTKEYKAWAKIKGRCTNPRDSGYRLYGAIGRTMHPEWVESFSAFFEHIGQAPSPKHSVDRIDNDRGYEPGNVRWATASQQSRNTSRTIRVNGECLKDVCERDGINYARVLQRIRKGATIEQAMSPTAGRSYRAMLSAGENHDASK